MACSLPCCGGFCLVVSIISVIMQFTFYIILKSGSERLDIGDTIEERQDYAKTALWTAVIYLVFTLFSIGCIWKGNKSSGKADFIQQIPSDDDNYDDDVNAALMDNNEPKRIVRNDDQSNMETAIN
mmetsp:Transcript_7757/g.9647  ORF Transcript_7757/g.9647 Transcript_7757/m.9647 type:complete len:126 (+) Transcript_7757:105-482(+)